MTRKEAKLLDALRVSSDEKLMEIIDSMTVPEIRAFMLGLLDEQEPDDEQK